MIKERKCCRACLSEDLALVLDLGKTPLANDFLLPEEIKGYSTSLPLRFVVCRKCSLAQLGDSVNPEVLYSHYAYVTSTSRTMEAHLEDQKQHLMQMTGLNKPPKVLEIASNTGLYLKKFQESGCDVLGIEPAANIAKIGQEKGVPTRVEFFDSRNARKLRETWGAADLIIGRHVFAHIDDLKDLLAGLEAISHPGTLIAFEVPYMLDLFERVEFDTIYHEHSPNLTYEWLPICRFVQLQLFLALKALRHAFVRLATGAAHLQVKKNRPAVDAVMIDSLEVKR